MIFKRKTAFTMVEILVVIVLISCGLLPVYSVIRSGQRRINRADARTVASLYGASAIELARTLGFNEAQRLTRCEEYQQIKAMAAKSHYNMTEEVKIVSISKGSSDDDPIYLLKVHIQIDAIQQRDEAKVPTLHFVAVISNPRDNFY